MIRPEPHSSCMISFGVLLTAGQLLTATARHCRADANLHANVERLLFLQMVYRLLKPQGV